VAISGCDWRLLPVRLPIPPVIAIICAWEPVIAPVAVRIAVTVGVIVVVVAWRIVVAIRIIIACIPTVVARISVPVCVGIAR